MLTRDRILEKTNSQAILNYYIQRHHSHGYPHSSDLKKGMHVSNPFLAEKQRTPSFNIYPARNGEWRFHDFATGDTGSCFDFVMRLFRIEFKDALHRINADLMLGL